MGERRIPGWLSGVIGVGVLLAMAPLYFSSYVLGLRVPEDVSVVGFDDSSLATAVHPCLTTVSQPVSDKGRLAVAALLESMGSPAGDPVRTVLPTSLVVRDSTAPPPSDS